VGRLIRDTEDFGVVMLCDPRLVTKGYGRIFIQSLPPMRRTRELAEAQAFLRERLGIGDGCSVAASLTAATR
jgi:ATP-dependent DNA helicase DinG